MKIKLLMIVLVSLLSQASFSVLAGNTLNQIKPSPKIVGGTDTIVSAYPWMANLLIASEPDATKALICGASLISEDVILTAAHCVEPRDIGGLLSSQPSDLEITIGAHNLKNITVNERIGVSAVYKHIGYTGDFLMDNDIALIKLKTPVKNTPLDYIDPLLMQQIVHGDLLTVIGWGALDSISLVMPDVLQEVQVPYVNYIICNDTMGGVSGNSICAGPIGGGKDSCYGDSGGPLVYNNNGKYFQVGVVSWGNECAAPNSYGVYTKVANYNNWIIDTTGQVNLSQDTDFGAQGVDIESSIQVTAFNWSSENKSIKSVSLSDTENFEIKTDTCSEKTVLANKSCYINIEFQPNQAVPLTSTLTIVMNSGKMLTSTLSGIGLAQVDLNSAVDNNHISLYTGGDAMWSEDTTVPGSVNGSAMASGKIVTGETSYVSTQVDGSGTLTFNWKVVKKNFMSFSFVSLIIDRKTYVTLFDEGPFITETILLGPGKHVITWLYTDFSPTVADSGTALIDNVNWVKTQ